jgi:hypothetical protein
MIIRRRTVLARARDAAPQQIYDTVRQKNRGLGLWFFVIRRSIVPIHTALTGPPKGHTEQRRRTKKRRTSVSSV